MDMKLVNSMVVDLMATLVEDGDRVAMVTISKFDEKSLRVSVLGDDGGEDEDGITTAVSKEWTIGKEE